MRWSKPRLLAPRTNAPARWPKRVFLTLLGVSIAVLGVWSVIDLLDAASSLRSAENRIHEADRALTEARVGDAQRALDEAEAFLEDANRDLRLSPGLVLARRIPVISSNIEALDDTVETAATLVHGGRQILATSDRLQDESGNLAIELKDGSIPAAAVDRATTEIRALLVSLTDRPDVASSIFVLPQIKDVQRNVFDEVDVQEEHLLRLRGGLSILDHIVGASQSRRTVLAVANTAEMRGSGGMMLNYGILEGTEGGVTIEEFGRVGELPVVAPPDPDTLGIPGDFQERWSNFDYTRDWRNATLSGDFTQDAPTLLAMFRAATQQRADNVIQVDAHALAAMLRVTGPVLVDPLGSVTADNVVDLVLNEAYVLFPDRETRADILGDVAEATFRALVEGQYSSVADIAEALNDAVAGRHLMMYSDDPGTQASIDSFGATGELPVVDRLDHLHLSVQNMGGNKLDYYVDTALDVTGQRLPGEIGEMTVTVRVTNNAPVGTTEPGYIFGPSSEGMTAGTYRAMVTLYVPQGTSLNSSSGDAFFTAPSTGSEDNRALVSYWIDLPAGATHEAVLDLRLQPVPTDSDYSMLLVPSPRVRPTVASVSIDTGDGGSVAGDVTLDRTWRIDESGPAEVPSL